MQSFKNKTFLITGAAGGIGSLLAKQLYLKESALLILVDKDIKKLVKLKNHLEKKLQNNDNNKSIKIFAVDLANKSSILNFYEQIKNIRVDVLVNNAGITYTGPFLRMDIENFEKVMDINLYAVIYLTHLLLAELIKNKGHIVNVSSGAGLLATAGMNAYATSKFGLVGFTEALRAELRGLIGVSVICPAFVQTHIAKRSLLSSELKGEEKLKHLAKLDDLVNKLGVPPEKVCKAIIMSIKKNKGLVTVGFATDMLWTIKKIVPKFADIINATLYKKFVKDGIIK